MGRSGARRGALEVQPRAARRSSSRLLGQAARAPLRRRSRPRTRPPLHNPTDLRHPVSRCDIDSHRDCRPILILIVAPRRIAQNRGFHPRSRRRLPPVRVSSARSQHQPCRARSDARTSTAVRYPPGGVGVSVLRVGSRARARCATAVRRVTGRSGGRRSSRDEGDAGRGRGVSGYHLAGGRRSQAASRASFSVRRPAGLPGTRRIAQNRGFHPRSRRRLPPVRVSSARSRLQPCRARSDARTSTAVRYSLRRHAGARPARIPRRVLHCLDSIYTRTLPDDNRRSLFISQ